MSEALDVLVELLDLEAIEVNVYRGTNPAHERQRTFGGQVAAQALRAAGRTVEEGRVHSLHSYFLRPGDPTTPILYEVDRIRDGQSFTTRRVVAIQHGYAIFNMQASFHRDEVSYEHQVTMPDVPGPESVAPLAERLSGDGSETASWFRRRLPIDLRYLGDLPFAPDRSGDAVQRLWMKTVGELPDDDLLHACVVAYASDMSIFEAILGPHPVNWEDGSFMGASLDHCMWFHHPPRADQWLFYDIDSPIAFGGRGLARGSVFTRDGQLTVSMVQEGLVRRLRPR